MKKRICFAYMVICMVGIVCACMNAIADRASDTPDETETVVSLVWENKRIDVSFSEWSKHSFQISTEDVGLGNGKVYDFVGVKLSDLIKLAGADECTKALVKSTDGLTGEVSAEDIRNYDIALVNGYSGGTPLSVNKGGPVKIIFPVSEHPELNDTYTLRSWQWYVCEVEFIKQYVDEKNPLPTKPETGKTKEPVGISAEPLTGKTEEASNAFAEFRTGKIENHNGVTPVEFGYADRCVIIVLDAFSSNYLTRLGSESSLVRMSAEGTSCPLAHSTYPTQTCTNHATIMTGVGAARHGIVGNVHLGEDRMTSVKNIQPEMIQAPTLFQIASAAGKKTAFVSGKDDMITLFSEGLDVGISNKRPLRYLLAAPELEDNSSNDEYYHYDMDLANWVFESLFTVFEKEKPDLTMVNIQSTDYIAHRFGPESKEMDACLKAVDENLGKLLQKMEQTGMLDNTAVIVTADHGMTPADKAIPLIALSLMNFPDAGAVIDGRNGYIWYGTEDKEAVIRFYENVEGIRNVFERESDEARLLNVDFSNGPDLFLETEPGYVFLPGPLIDLFHGQHGSRDESDRNIPLICVGAGIPSHAEIEQTDLRCIAPLVCHLLRLSPGDFDLEVPSVYMTEE